MLDTTTLDLDGAQGTLLTQAAYKQDFRDREWEIEGRDSWKLERRQHFHEAGNASWKAFIQGDWSEALRLIESRREALMQFSRKAEDHGVALYRVRVVEEPLSPYVQWELNSLRVRAECGERIRLVFPQQIAPLESSGKLPELVTLGGRTLYDIRYTASGVPDGAVRFIDPDLVESCEAVMRSLYEAGEDVASYVEREVAHLPPPQAQ
ncbi:hypothetical protein GCM10009716_17960 [Streptomyces sodiiphilus]|uniref:DUF6879 domain-containing protein n=1 Tax=Streptomyces sodiiphilus TaxID=226217 RepID=A0ABN2P0N2_9ACTN